jgi:hypothetical protein
VAEVIQFRGDPLPAGLPGFGGSSSSQLNLDGISGFVRPLIFGAIVNAPTVTVPSSTPPAGSNPSNPTTSVVTPAQAPPANYYNQTTTSTTNITNITNINSICPDCRSESNVGSSPLLSGFRANTGNCYDCAGILGNRTRYFSTPAANTFGEGLFYTAPTTLSGKGLTQQWTLNGTGLKLYDGGTYSSQSIKVCVNGETTTWYILASTS